MTRPRHLVLGGSCGIGFAYAGGFGQRGDDLWIVALGRERLAGAARKLAAAAGAAEMRSSAVDLIDPKRREEFLCCRPLSGVQRVQTAGGFLDAELA